MKLEIEKLRIFNETGDDCKEIQRISAKELTYNDFFYKFMARNVPVILKDVELVPPECKQLFENDHFSIDKFREKIGSSFADHQVPVYNCSKQYFNSHEKSTISFAEFEEYWKSEEKVELLYLQDFHCVQEFPHLNLYNVPQYFSSDWLNEYLLDQNEDDYRFVYIGVRGTW
jgi:hypothetical protein